MKNTMTFDNLVIHEGNRDAVIAAKKILYTNEPEILYIYGKSGFGKTHILNAIYTELLNVGVEKICCITAEEFTNEMVNILRKGVFSQFREKYHNFNVLLIDAFQFASGKNAVLSEMQFIIETIIKNGGKIILASDKNLDMLNIFEQLENRLYSGITVEITQPDDDALINIASSLSERFGADIPTDTLAALVKENKNPWRLSGAIKTLMMTMIQNEKNKYT